MIINPLSGSQRYQCTLNYVMIIHPFPLISFSWKLFFFFFSFLYSESWEISLRELRRIRRELKWGSFPFLSCARRVLLLFPLRCLLGGSSIFSILPFSLLASARDGVKVNIAVFVAAVAAVAAVATVAAVVSDAEAVDIATTVAIAVVC